MAKIKVIKSSSVKSIKAQFKKEFDCSIRIYKGARIADDSAKISDLSTLDNAGGELDLGARSRVENVEKYFKDTFGIKVQISNSADTKLADNEMTLTQAGKC
jgi:predicted RNA-binding protein (virulence factor B family)